MVLQNGDSAACGFSNDGAVYMDNAGFSNVLVDNNTIHDGHWLIQLQIGSGTNLQFFNNNTYDADHLMAVGIASNATINGFYIYDSIWGSLARWDNGFGCHHDSIHIFTQGANNTGTVQNLFIYNNEFNGPVGADPTAHIYLEPNGGIQTINTGWVFNNVMRYQASNPGECGNGCANGLGFGAAGSSSVTILNNTLYGDGLGLCGGVGLSSVRGVTYGNSVTVDCNQLVGFGSGAPQFLSGQPDYNTYAQSSGSNAWQVGDSFFPGTQFAAYQAAIGGEAHSRYSASTSSVLNTANFTLVSGSPAIGTAQNFFSTCNGKPVPGIGALCNDKPLTVGPGSGATVGNARSSNLAWDAGAYSSGLSASQPTPPSDLIASVN